jgi:hypothetical protein
MLSRIVIAARTVSARSSSSITLSRASIVEGGRTGTDSPSTDFSTTSFRSGVSTDQQAESGAGMAAQRNSIRRHCSHHGLELSRIYEDNGASGKGLRNRPGLTEALDVLAKGDTRQRWSELLPGGCWGVRNKDLGLLKAPPVSCDRRTSGRSDQAAS